MKSVVKTLGVSPWSFKIFKIHSEAGSEDVGQKERPGQLKDILKSTVKTEGDRSMKIKLPF